MPSAFFHFGTDEPDEEDAIDYKSLPKLSDANVWAQIDDDSVKRIAAESSAIRGINLSEAEYIDFSIQTFLHHESRISSYRQTDNGV
jgi:hypothetical protein